MKAWIGFDQAARLSLWFFGVILLAHLGVIVGIVAFDFAPMDYLWGGKFSTADALLEFEFISLAVMSLCFFVVMVRSGRIKAGSLVKAARVALWVMAGLFVLNTVGNLLAASLFEKCFAVVTAVLALLCLRLAVEPVKKHA